MLAEGVGSVARKEFIPYLGDRRHQLSLENQDDPEVQAEQRELALVEKAFLGNEKWENVQQGYDALSVSRSESQWNTKFYLMSALNLGAVSGLSLVVGGPIFAIFVGMAAAGSITQGGRSALEWWRSSKSIDALESIDGADIARWKSHRDIESYRRVVEFATVHRAASLHRY